MGSKTHTGYRSAKSGKFITERQGKANPDKSVREQIPNPGRGDTKK